MNELEAQVRCLEAALQQARNENHHGDVNRVVQLQKEFYTLVSGGQESEKAIPPTEPLTIPASAPKRGKDKPAEIFR